MLDEPDVLFEKSGQFEELIETEFDHCIEKRIVVSSPNEFYLSSEDFFSKCTGFHGPVNINSLKTNAQEELLNGLEVKNISQMVGNFDMFADQAIKWISEGQKIVIVAPTKAQIRRIHELMSEWGFEIDVDLGRLSQGFHCKSSNLVFISEH